MGRLQTIKPRVQSAKPRIHESINYGRGRNRYAPGRDSRRERVFKRDQFQCQACKEKGVLKILPLHSKDREAVGYVDHYIPLAQGGDDTERNQWLLCKACHDAKSIEDSKGVYREPRNFGVYELCGFA